MRIDFVYHSTLESNEEEESRTVITRVTFSTKILRAQKPQNQPVRTADHTEISIKTHPWIIHRTLRWAIRRDTYFSLRISKPILGSWASKHLFVARCVARGVLL